MHGEDKDDNAPDPDMNPMIDVVFQLLIFFLVTMKFKTLDMKIEAFLPKDKGLAKTLQEPDEKPKLVAVIKRKRGENGISPTTGERIAVARVKVANTTIGTTLDPLTWDRLTTLSRETLERHIANGGAREDVSGEVDASRDVPTGMVIRAVDAFVAAGIENVTFVGAPPPGSGLDALMDAAEK